MSTDLFFQKKEKYTYRSARFHRLASAWTAADEYWTDHCDPFHGRSQRNSITYAHYYNQRHAFPSFWCILKHPSPNTYGYIPCHSSLQLRVYLNVFKCYQSFCHNGKEWWGLGVAKQMQFNCLIFFRFRPWKPTRVYSIPNGMRPALIPTEWYDREHARHVAPRRPMQPKPGPKPITPGEAWYGPQAMKRCASTPLYQACDNSCIVISWQSAKVGE